MAYLKLLFIKSLKEHPLISNKTLASEMRAMPLNEKQLQLSLLQLAARTFKAQRPSDPKIQHSNTMLDRNSINKSDRRSKNQLLLFFGRSLNSASS
ncbi:hypothetical protein AVEN_104215-1 [Araneus ventricosus]|uniref:Uncharacterized protein n=1 Tax=Araneus ventricosus TaxID=182803 RepID=A0A4Y2JXC9_ARAVE|nr:hypothetical protein AVEN_104215-1 [Araneus ventricosus]